MPWSVAPLRTGRSWVLGPDPETLRARWDRLLRASGTEREALFRTSRARGLHVALPQLPGHDTPTRPLAREDGPCPEPVPVRHGPFDRQWLIPDQRLLDAARPELWRVADEAQLFAVEPGRVTGGRAPGGTPAAEAGTGEPVLLFSEQLPDGRSPAGRPGRIRPLFRRPGAREPNLAPGLAGLLADRLGLPVAPLDFLAWTAAAAGHRPAGRAVPLPLSPGVWQDGVTLGRRVLWLHTYGARCAPAPGERPKLPGGQRPYVRSALPTALGAFPAEPHYDPEERTLHLGAGRIAPVPPAAWDYTVSGVPVLAHWYERRAAPAEPGSLSAVRPARWPARWTSELLELITVLALLDALRPALEDLAERLAEGPRITAAALREAGVLPAPAAAARPASVLEHPEEGPNGQVALL
ncbi:MULTISPECIES: type ISP restriction/modification enzyme [Streptomyces]|uniref:DNA methyltransferase n=1 Tax=Streptomyces lycii TaxID=2654337 RepID=A0ABQ7F9G7_9ACTN|nr:MULTISPECIES: type ISP restriction/modification enzyme [Streptomyces]KAF4405661.1 DNA methyltransferase [Streptomyces lycii]PGH51165.1 DNA methyltransferase [Streptomyces sp. Ru87]